MIFFDYLCPAENELVPRLTKNTASVMTSPGAALIFRPGKGSFTAMDEGEYIPRV
jgi:hypothetical protein